MNRSRERCTTLALALAFLASRGRPAPARWSSSRRSIPASTRQRRRRELRGVRFAERRRPLPGFHQRRSQPRRRASRLCPAGTDERGERDGRRRRVELRSDQRNRAFDVFLYDRASGGNTLDRIVRAHTTLGGTRIFKGSVPPLRGMLPLGWGTAPHRPPARLPVRLPPAAKARQGPQESEAYDESPGITAVSLDIGSLETGSTLPGTAAGPACMAGAWIVSASNGLLSSISRVRSAVTQPRKGSRPPPKGDRPPWEGRRPPQKGKRSPEKGNRPPRKGSRPPFGGNVPLKWGTIPLSRGTVPPRRGSFPLSRGKDPPPEGEDSPFERVGSPFQGSVPPFEGSFSPFEGDISPFQGSFSPFEGDVSPLEGDAPP